jgi:hypothetical protein
VGGHNRTSWGVPGADLAPNNAQELLVRLPNVDGFRLRKATAEEMPSPRRAPANAKRLVAGDIVLFYAGQKFGGVGRTGVYGIALAGTARQEAAKSPAVSPKNWRFRVRWLPASQQGALSPFQGHDREFAPAGTAGTLLRVEAPSRRVSEFVPRAVADALPDSKAM